MHLSPENLPERGYVLLEKMEHADLIPFVKKYVGVRNKTMTFYIAFNILVLAYIGYLFGYNLSAGEIPFATQFLYFCNGILLAFLSLPVHELLHAGAYRMVGAKQTSIEAHWRKFYFLALADRFVTTRRAFMFVALAPFVVLTAVALALMVVLPAPWTFALSSAVIAHTSMCAGDFGLLSFFEEHRHLEVVTYDDVAEGTSYFWSRVVADGAR